MKYLGKEIKVRSVCPNREGAHDVGVVGILVADSRLAQPSGRGRRRAEEGPSVSEGSGTTTRGNT